MNFFKQWVPIFELLPSYQKADLRGDAIAGITVAMMLIPHIPGDHEYGTDRRTPFFVMTCCR
jgi:MFS superfamily sulfate permease-like transporter